MMEMVRVANEVDADQLVRLVGGGRVVAAASRGGPMYLLRDARQPPLEAMVADALGDARQLVLLGTLDDVAVGYAIARLEELVDGSVITVVDEIYVEPPGRQLGVGEA